MSRKQISVKPCCKVCKDAGKPEAMFSSHFVKDRTGKVICPLLLSQECRYCFKLGHTVKFCQALNNVEPGEKGVRRIRDQVYESRKPTVLQKYEEKPETKEKPDYEFPPLSPNVTLRPHQMSWNKEIIRPLSAAKGVPNSNVDSQRSWVKITSTILNPKETLPVLQPQPTINSWTTPSAIASGVQSLFASLTTGASGFGSLQTMLSSHDKIMIPCIHTNKLMELWELDIDDSDPEKMKNYINLRNAEVILINEAQFFEDLIPCVQSMLKEKKTIYISGLDGDFERKKFGNIIDLIPLCDKVTKLSSLCNLCKNGSPGLFSLRLTKEKQQMLIGTDNYIPVCRACYDTNC